MQNVSVWLGFGVTYLCLPLSLLPVPQDTVAHPPSRSSAESKVPFLLPSTCFGSEPMGVCIGPIATQSEDVSGSFSSAKVLNSIPHRCVTSHEDFYRNMAGDCCPEKHQFGVIWSIHFYATKAAFDFCKLLREMFDGLL